MVLQILLRAVYFIVFFLSGLFFPWWLFALVGILGIILFPLYFEALFVGLFFDALYAGGAVASLFVFPFFYSVIFLIFFFLFQFLKQKFQYL